MLNKITIFDGFGAFWGTLKLFKNFESFRYLPQNQLAHPTQASTLRPPRPKKKLKTPQNYFLDDFDACWENQNV